MNLFYFYSAVLHEQSALGEQVYGLRICDALLLKNPCGKRIRSVVVFDGAASLDNYRPAIVFIGAEVDGASADFAAGLENSLVDVMSPHPLSAEARQKGRVYIYYAVFVSVGYFPQAQPAALNNEVNVGGKELLFDVSAEPVDVGEVLFANDFYVQPGGLCLFRTGRFRARAYYDGNFGVEAALSDIFEDIHHCRAAAANQYAEPGGPYIFSAVRCGQVFDILFEVQCLVYEPVGLFVFISRDVLNVPFFESVEQIDGLAEERFEIVAFDLVFAEELPDEQLTVAEELYMFGAELFCGIERFYDCGVFGDVVRGFAEEEGLGQQPGSVFVGKDECSSGGAWVSSAAAVGINDELFSLFRQCISPSIRHTNGG